MKREGGKCMEWFKGRMDGSVGLYREMCRPTRWAEQHSSQNTYT